MGTEQNFGTKRIDHGDGVAGIAARIRHEFGLIETIDQVVGPSDPKVICGSAVQAMVLNGLGFTSRALEFAKQTLKSSAAPNSMRWIFEVFEALDELRRTVGLQTANPLHY